MIKKRIECLRKLMQKNNMDAYIIFTNDYHGSEYIADYFKSREYISGFTGSAGTVLVTKDKAYLWTDGRYFVQAAMELKDTGIELKKQGIDIGLLEYLKDKAKSARKYVVGMDGRCISISMAQKLEEINNLEISYKLDLIGEIWDERPNIKYNKIWHLDNRYTKYDAIDKIKELRCEYDEDILIVSALDEVAYITNLRGNDIEYTPVFFGYLVVEEERVLLFTNVDQIEKEAIEYLEKNSISVCEYNEMENYIKSIKDKSVRIDKESLNYSLARKINSSNTLVLDDTPIKYMKAIKNEVELENMKKAHIMDGVAVTKFIYYVKNNYANAELDEYNLGKLIAEFRKENETYIEESFSPIVAYNENGAIVHYSARKDNKIKIGDGILLVDTGGHYLEGTTDITRTISLGKITEEMKRVYTLVLKGHLRLQNAVFKRGSSSVALDGIAREALWKQGLDYNHGTGHGVGYLLSVHEGPNAIRTKSSPKPKYDSIVPGMVVSNEPGCYLEGQFGVRIENLIMCQKESDDFYKFEPMTVVPYDKELIDVNLLNEEELEYLREYQRKVIFEIKDKLDNKEREWLINQMI